MSIYTKFLEEKGKKHRNELTREEFNEYQRLYYNEKKDKFTQHRELKKCEVCEIEVKNMNLHSKTRNHLNNLKCQQILKELNKYKLILNETSLPISNQH